MKRRTVSILGAVVVLAAVPATWGAIRVFDFESIALYGTADDSCVNNPTPPLFNRAEYANATKDFIVDPAGCGKGTLGGDNGSDSLLTAQAPFVGERNEELRFSWVDPTDSTTWVRVITGPASGVEPKFPAPVISFGPGDKVSMKFSLYALDATEQENLSGAVEVSLIVRETGDDLPLGERGATSGFELFFVGVDSANIAAPYTPDGGTIIQDGLVWHTVEWTFGTDPTKVMVSLDGGTPVEKNIVQALGTTGDGVLSSPNMRGTLDSLAIRKPSGATPDTITKKIFLNIDDVIITSSTPDPLRILSPVPAWATGITVAFIDNTDTTAPAPDGAEAVRLYKNNVLVATATPPYSDAANRKHVFSTAGLGLVAGDVLKATQVLGGVESAPSPEVTVVGVTVLDDFTTGPTYTSDPGAGPTYDNSRWYGAHQCTFGSVTSANFTGTSSKALKYSDGGFTNGLYRKFEAVVPKSGTFRVKADVHVVETGSSGLNGPRAWQLGVTVNGNHRPANNPGCDCVGTNADLGSLLDAAAIVSSPSYQGLTSGDDTSKGPQTLVTPEFNANAGDSIVVSFSTAVTGGIGSSGRFRANSGTWGTTYVLIDNLVLVEPEPCEQTAAVTVQTPVVAGQTTVTVTNVVAAPEAVTVYANGVQIGTKTSGFSGTGTEVVSVTPLVANQVITATQTVAGIQGCVPTVGPKVNDCSQIGAVTVSGPLAAGATTVTVTGLSAGATAVTVYAVGNPTPLGTKTSGISGTSTTVTVTPLVKGQMIVATQTISGLAGCTPTSGGPVVGSGHNAAIRLSLGIREGTSFPGEIGDDGSASQGTAIEWIIPDDPNDPNDGTVTSGAPQGKLITPGPQWQTVTFNPTAESVIRSFSSGNGVLDGAKGVLEHLAISIDAAAPDTGPYTLYVDNVTSGGITFETFEAANAGATVLFRQPSYSGSTSANIATTPNVAVVDDTRGDASTKSNRIQWSFRDESVSRWIRLTTDRAPARPTPIVDLTQPITIRVLLLPACKAPTVTGPLAAGSTTVQVVGVDAAATLVSVYEGANLIGTAVPDAGAATVTVSPALSKGQSITATQTIDGVENCNSAAAIVGSGVNKGLLLTLGIRENTSLTGGVGADGGTTGANITWVGASTKNGTAPIGKPITPSTSWQTITFDPATDPRLAFTGAGTLDGTFGVLEHLAITAGPDSADTGPYVLYIDNVSSGGSVFADFESFDAGKQVMFQEPTFSGSTSANLLTLPSVSTIDATRGDASAKSVRIEFQFKDEAATRWVRLTTNSTGAALLDGLGNPQVDLTQPISLRYLLLPACTPPTVTAVAPTSAATGATVSVSITGATNLVVGGTTVKLRKTGETDIVATNVVVAGDGLSLTADLNLAGAALGLWDVVVSTCADATLAGAFEVTSACATPPQDVDGDGDVDLTDFGVFQACFNGPNRPWPGPPVDQQKCACLDTDKDLDVDLTDFGFFQTCFNGPNRPASCP